MKQSRETLLRKKREYAARVYAERSEFINEMNRQSRQRAKEANPDKWRERTRAYNAAYHARHPEKRKATVKRYYEKNRTLATSGLFSAQGTARLPMSITVLALSCRLGWR
jgi:metal-responsive CopG/Arc/MetJ family transcriptional regulator